MSVRDGNENYLGIQDLSRLIVDACRSTTSPNLLLKSSDAVLKCFHRLLSNRKNTISFVVYDCPSNLKDYTMEKRSIIAISLKLRCELQ